MRGTWLKPLMTVRDEWVMRPALKEETDKVAIQCGGWRKSWVKKEHLEEIKEGLEGFLEEVTLEQTAAKFASSEPDEWSGKNIQVEGITSTKAWSQGAHQGALRNWVWNAKDEERESLRLAPQAAIWTTDSLVSLGWTGEKTFLEHNFRDVSLQCERVGVVEQATN